VLDPTPWAIIGAVATRLYMPEQLATGLDALVSGADLDACERRLARAGWERAGDLSTGGSSWCAPGGVPVDVVCTSATWVHAALSEAQTNRDRQGLPIIPLRYLILLKLEASRTSDTGDITRMLGMADDAALEAVRGTVGEFAASDLEDLNALIGLGKLEHGRRAGKPGLPRQRRTARR
jgi:hypothetical protein